MSSPRPRTALALCFLAAVTLSACITGERPRFDEEQTARTDSGNAAIDEVLDRLDSVSGATLTAVYDITGADGETERATVVLADGGRRSITVGDVRYLIEPGNGITCDVPTAECEPSVNDARISDLQLTHEFYAPAFATRLRVDADRRIQDPTATTADVAGREATCVSVPVTGGDKVYCALDAGLLARYQGPDALIELVRVRNRPNEALFETGG